MIGINMIHEPVEREDLQRQIANEGMCLSQRADGTIELWICNGYDPDDEDLGSRFTGLTFDSVQGAFDYVFGVAHLAHAMPLWAR
jgi:hypothetical protein